ETHPKQSFRIRPNAPRSYTRPRRRHHQGIATYCVDLGNVVARERGVPYIAIGRGRNTIRSNALRSFPGFNLPVRGIDTSINTVLAGEPENAFSVKGRGIEIGVGKFLWQRKKPDGFCPGIETCDRVLSAFGNPRCAIRADNHTMRCGAFAE